MYICLEVKEFEEFGDQFGHGEKGGPCVEPVTIQFKGVQFATGVLVGLIHIHPEPQSPEP